MDKEKLHSVNKLRVTELDSPPAYLHKVEQVKLRINQSLAPVIREASVSAPAGGIYEDEQNF